MSLSSKKRNDIDTAITSGRVPNRTQGNRTILPLGRVGDPGRYIVLATTAGLTKAGEYYYQQTGGQRPTLQFDPNQIPTQDSRGNTYIQGRNNKRLLVRRIAADGTHRLTALGKRYYSQDKTEYIVHVPVHIKGRHKNGRTYERFDKLPTDLLNTGKIMMSSLYSEDEKVARIKSNVLQELGENTEGGMTVLMQQSGETYYYDRNGEWQISSMSTMVRPDGSADTQVRLREVLAGLNLISCMSHLPFTEDCYLPEAFEDHGDKLCVCRQLAVLTKTPLDLVIEKFNDLVGNTEWQKEGLCAEQIKDYAILNGSPFFFVANNTLLSVYEPVQKTNRAIAVVAYDGHAFFLKSARPVANWTLRDGISIVERSVIQHEIRSQLPPLEEWQEWKGTPAPGHFYTRESLQKVRLSLLKDGRNPRVILKRISGISALRYHCVQRKDNTSGVCVIRQLPPEATAIQKWIANLPVNNIKYCGEGLAGVTLKVFNSLMTAERKHPTHEMKDSIIREQEGKCNHCGAYFGEDAPEFDHVVPLQQTVAGEEQEFQALCKACHDEKTVFEGRQDRSIESCFNEVVWEEYVRSQRPTPLVFTPHEYNEQAKTELELDVIRCRRGAMAHSPVDFSIFSPLDSIEKAQPGELADFSYVFIRNARQRSPLSLLPYTGKGWYHRIAVEFMLHWGICSWLDVEYSLSSTAHVSSSLLRKILDQMEVAWGTDPDNYRKLSVNSMIGLFSVDDVFL